MGKEQNHGQTGWPRAPGAPGAAGLEGQAGVARALASLGVVWGAQEVPLHGPLPVHRETRARERSLHLCLKIPGASPSRRRRVAWPT